MKTLPDENIYKVEMETDNESIIKLNAEFTRRNRKGDVNR